MENGLIIVDELKQMADDLHVEIPSTLKKNNPKEVSIFKMLIEIDEQIDKLLKNSRKNNS